jgi:hypothetical protein
MLPVLNDPCRPVEQKVPNPEQFVMIGFFLEYLAVFSPQLTELQGNP